MQLKECPKLIKPSVSNSLIHRKRILLGKTIHIFTTAAYVTVWVVEKSPLLYLKDTDFQGHTKELSCFG